MSIRSRLVVLCAVIALLPAIPLSYLVKALLEKSFNLGLNASVEQALQNGLAISRDHLTLLHGDFEREVAAAVAELSAARFDGADAARPDSTGVARVLATTPQPFRSIDGFFIAAAVAEDGAESREDGDASSLEAMPGFRRMIGSARINARAGSAQPDGARSGGVDGRGELAFYDTDDRAFQFALWRPDGAAGDRAVSFDATGGADGARDAGSIGVAKSPGGTAGALCFCDRIDPAFLERANQLLANLQLFAQLRLTQPTLSRSFFYPFIIIYCVILCLSLVLALFMAERLAQPIRRLSAGAAIVADGDWGHRVNARAGGEVGRLVHSFNWMVSRLESQHRRLLDLEKMATWREMARHLAHEVKNPLLPIRLTVQELRDQYRGDDATYKTLVEESVRVVEDELSHLQKLVKEFSAFAKMPDLEPQPGSLSALLSDVVKLYPQIPATVGADPSAGDFSFDPDQLRRALVNLMDNAVSALEHTADPVIRISIDRAGDDVTITFSDNGPGIPPEHREAIFEPYYTMKSGGSGLGLAIVKNIVLLHGGSIRAEDNEWGGATFVITLPVGAAGEAPQTMKQPDAPW